MAAVANPAHILYVPPPLWGVAWTIASALGMIVGIITQTGMRADVALGSTAVLVVYFGFAYRADKHVWKKLKLKYWDGAPKPPFHVTKGIVPQGPWNRFT
jgi:hypothetical protein